MSAQIAETIIFDAHCPECGGSAAQFTNRSDAETAATEHDAEWHVPVFDDELVP